VRGTVVGVRGIYNCVLADSLSFPEQDTGGKTENSWWVSIEWKGVEQALDFWDYGQYSLGPLPCQNAKGQFEALNVLVSKFRQYQIPVQPAAAPAGQAKPAEGGAAVPNVEAGTPH